MPEPERKRIVRSMRFDDASWTQLTAMVDAANAQGMRTNAREVVEALIHSRASDDPANAAQLVQSFRIAQAAAE